MKKKQLYTMAKTNQNIPHVRQISLMMQTMKQLVCSRLNWSEEQYNEFQFESGIAFIEGISSRLLNSDVEQLKASRIFWGWWRNQWFSRDVAGYDEILMTEASYRLQNTGLVTQLQKSFWDRVSSMLADGECRLKKQEDEDGI